MQNYSDSEHAAQTGMVTLMQPLDLAHAAFLLPVIEQSVAESIPGHRYLHGHYVGPVGAEIHLSLSGEQVFAIGRKTGSSDLYLEYADVSRNHATIRIAQGMMTLTDENSLNGTFLNERRVAPQRAQILQSGDTLRFGLYGIYLFLVP
jgi:FHA domain